MAYAADIHYEPFDEATSKRLTKLIMKLFSLWKLTYEEQAVLLGLSSGSHASIHRYKRGESFIRLNQDTYDRIRFLLGIHKTLRILFPENLALAYAWIKSPNAQFNDHTPLSVAIQRGFLGVVSVYDYLESVKTHI